MKKPSERSEKLKELFKGMSAADINKVLEITTAEKIAREMPSVHLK